MTIQMKATEQYFPLELFIMLYKWMDPMDEILVKDNSNENSLAVLFFGCFCLTVLINFVKTGFGNLSSFKLVWS